MVVINSRSKRSCSPFRATTYRHSKQSQACHGDANAKCVSFPSHEQSLKSWSCRIKHFLRRFIFRRFRSPSWDFELSTFESPVHVLQILKEPVFAGVENSTRSVDSLFMFPPTEAMRDRGQRHNKLQQSDKEGGLWELDRRAYETRTCYLSAIV